MTSCPVCAMPTEPAFISLEVPINCSTLYPSREVAQAATKGTVALTFCRGCATIFNSEYEPALLQYNSNYDNSLSYSGAFRSYCTRLIRRLIDSYSLRNRTIVEVGCGEGHFLAEMCCDNGNVGFGFDPAYRAGAPLPSVQIIPTLYSSEHSAIRADVVCCRHVLEHISDPTILLQTIRSNLSSCSSPLFYCEVPNAASVFNGPALWDVNYPHCCYFSSASLRNLLIMNGFRILRLEPSFDSQFLSAEAVPSISGIAGELATMEQVEAVERMIEGFKSRFRHAINDWTAQIEAATRQGKRIALWGTGAKAVTFVNAVAAASQIGLLVDSNPRKHGMFVAGTGQRIASPDELPGYRPDAIILLNPTYEAEIRQTLAEMTADADLWISSARSATGVQVRVG